MKRVLFLCVATAILITGCTASLAEQLSSGQFETLLTDDSKVQLIDVRTPEEYAQGHIENSTLMNFNAPSFKTQLEGLNKNKPIAVYCRSGVRSNQAVQIMKEMGFKKVYELKGGITAWEEGGKKIKK
ncbi:rhodanese-like domain-containing protein [Roseivirga echinicomitans]